MKWGILEQFNGSCKVLRGYTGIFVETSFGVYLIEVQRTYDKLNNLRYEIKYSSVKFVLHALDIDLLVNQRRN